MPSAKASALIDTRVIYCGDNLDQLRKFPAQCVDLVYIDPPFNVRRRRGVAQGRSQRQRLVLERDRIAAQARDADMKWKRKIVVGLETLAKYTAKHPKAQAALDELAREVRHPFDPSESG